MVLRVDSVSRRFGPIVACNDVSLTVSPGEVVALLGENGAGKSTLLSVIAGFVTPDAGTVSIDARRLQPGDPARAIQAGVGTAFQHFSLAPELGVRESLELARIDTDRALRHLPSHIHADARIRDLAVPERQQVELLKARMLARHVLLLDEPTSLLGDEDVERVLEQIRDAAAEGTGVVFVTHRLREALSVAHRILVMRRGWIVEQVTRPEGGWPEGTEDELLAAMFGEAWQGGMPDLPPSERSAVGATTRYLVRGLLAGRTVDISLEAGRWLAVAGIVGNGQGELVELLSGQTARQITEVPREGASVRHEGHGVADWAARNIAVVPEDRFAEGGAPEMRAPAVRPNSASY
jgi:simple sugar transport system ATP-binding protein